MRKVLRDGKLPLDESCPLKGTLRYGAASAAQARVK